MQPPEAIVLAAAGFAAIGSGAIAGLLFAFSNFVMKDLAEQTAVVSPA